MKKLIITADDYGMCDIVNKAIDDCVEAGLVTTTNVIVNMESLSAAGTLRTRYPKLSIGMHWNLTSGKPVSPINEVSSLVNPTTGEFYSVSQFIKRYRKGLLSKKEIELELQRQYDIFKSLCGEADYWNTHENSALDFKTYAMFNEVALRNGIKSTRTFRRVYVQDKRIEGVIANIKEYIKRVALDVWFGIIIPKTGTRLPEGRVIYFDSKQKTESLQNICENIQWGRKSIIELVVHPSISGEHRFFGTLSDVRIKEWQMFSNIETKSHIECNGVSLVGFKEINDGKA